jgi:hypothetical protein
MPMQQTIVEPPKPATIPDPPEVATILRVSDLQKTVDMMAPAIFLLALVSCWLMRRVVDLEERVGKLELPQ